MKEYQLWLLVVDGYLKLRSEASWVLHGFFDVFLAATNEAEKLLNKELSSVIEYKIVEVDVVG